MNTILLTTIVVLVLAQTIIKKNYLDKFGSGVYSLTAITALFVAIVFFITARGNLYFSSECFLYAIAYAVCYSLAAVFTLFAFATGPISIASLVLSSSAMIPVVYSIIAYDEPINTELVIGVILMMLSLFFANMEKKGVKKKITGKWLVYITIATVASGGCSLVQKIQQMNVGNGYDCKNEFMIVAFVLIVAVMFVCAVFSEREELGKNIRKGALYGFLCGVVNGACNYLVIVLSDPKMNMPASVMFPVISAGGIVLTAIVSVSLYKEKLSRMQWIGFVLGTASVIVLNL